MTRHSLIYKTGLMASLLGAANFLWLTLLDRRYLAYRAVDFSTGRTVPYALKHITVYLTFSEAAQLRSFQNSAFTFAAVSLVGYLVYRLGYKAR